MIARWLSTEWSTVDRVAWRGRCWRGRNSGFAPEDVAALLAYLETDGEHVTARSLPHTLPDADDLPFLEVATQAGAVSISNVVHYPPAVRGAVEVNTPVRRAAGGSGWEVENVDQEARTVRFRRKVVRDGTEPVAALSSAHAQAAVSRHARSPPKVARIICRLRKSSRDCEARGRGPPAEFLRVQAGR